MKLHRSRTPNPGHYELCGVVLEEVEHTKYLGITLSNSLEWGSDVDVITRKASNTLNFLQCNLKYCPKQAKQSSLFLTGSIRRGIWWCYLGPILAEW